MGGLYGGLLGGLLGGLYGGLLGGGLQARWEASDTAKGPVLMMSSGNTSHLVIWSHTLAIS